MHILFAIVLILAAISLLVVGLLSVLQDLLEHQPKPVLKEDGLSWPARYRGVATRTDSQLNRA